MVIAPSTRFGVSRRTFLAAAAAGVGGLALTACTTGRSSNPSPAPFDNDAIAAAEAARPHTGRTVEYTLNPQGADIDLGGIKVRTLAYGDSVPGQLIRANVGDELAITVNNGLDHQTSVHWHGIALRNDMDGALPASPNIESGQSFTYRFSVPHSGTYWAHPHVGLDTDYGLYLPIVVDDPREPVDYDTEWIVVLDDWTDGIGTSPQQILSDLQSGNGMGSMGGSGMGNMPGMGGMDHGSNETTTPSASGVPNSAEPSALLGGDAGDVSYPYYLVNGRIASAPTTFSAAAGQRVRIRIINAGADTAFRVALTDHAMTVTHTDGFPIVPREVDALLLGMGERYDVIVTVKDGVFPLVAAAEGKNAHGRALLRTGSGDAPDPSFLPRELTGRVGTVETFAAAQSVVLPQNEGTNVNLKADLGGDMMSYQWTINGRNYDQTEPLTVKEGDRARITFTNMTMMWHPMHLHGHTFQVVKSDGSAGPRKDTVIVRPMESVAVDLVADNPGDWMLHCHNGYHQEAGMMTRLDYVL
ncbi:multicopper oxidase family protein [Rhodococcus sp. IEGM 1241]|uniref:multicopper oxidase family protein n=1 Tax=Rhodococcus sp. IEGM 1241 TaxID=3082228 RepID=UPI0029555A22|nr:multicopper oxidase family protein [Rhodococcus sp. IEGM 1241]MDV8015535.1 multicopper oxidase family protein [Rhodococcus sp. IEGM 1241]